eukprot:CAMPEP_0181205936 /NCGR_PEP_ID=MMETSP1096-20121128/20752_1 /TAXON_ID=156174 ORGANISM="Chrysochromulina ericina, Strain CCMP281" /NCGR_SAMPLE_ID=MMETSP1096 /ASSEMBLY_ACC=CAM_ASM_000453 /LENGTH=213 /DNA_ID=CAMNT_0023296771 /DNA_START=205 /DNA_END=847 /DNA_ORIENTATION=-
MAPVNDLPGKYALNGEVFDPLGLANMFDVKWLREAEVKHGRICMLAWTGYVAVDLGLKLPGETLNSFKAHDAHLGDFGGAMGQIAFFIGLMEVLVSVPAINYTMNGGDREPGDYALDPLGFLDGATPEAKAEMQIKELKNGRLAMLAFSAVVTQSAMGHPDFPYGLIREKRTGFSGVDWLRGTLDDAVVQISHESHGGAVASSRSDEDQQCGS